jgi:1-acyl-sn-glycerol-3-phosphate acyltransferase
VCIFPDGKRNIKAENLEPKGGVAYLSHITNTPVIPLKISVEIERKKIIVRFGAPLYPKDIFPDLNNIILYKDHDDYKIAAKLIMKKVLEI